MAQQSASATPPAVTHADVTHLTGDIDDATVAAILATKASYVEIEEAVKWASGDAEQLGKSGRGLSPAAEAVYDILMADPTFEPPESDR